MPRVKYAMNYHPKNSFSMSYASGKVIFPGGEVYEAVEVTEEEEDEGSEEQTVSSKDMEHSVIVVAPRR